ncbi:2-oxo acid dehydrogenase subunit E2 [Streptomyces sp. NPDC057307]|uniref:2-oxo acid dehydrogenase subunit E2 n=1 Tax=Streptomyces sp. NPDC057307 TaxID=3346096 RepID=UPI00363BC318
MKGEPLARQRRHTIYFLEEIAGFAPVFLDTEVDMTRVREHRGAAKEAGRRYGVVSYVLHSAARVLARHPQANAAIHGRARPRIAEYDDVNGKVTFDKTIEGQRAVLSTVLTSLQRAELDDIQRQIEHFRDGNPETMPEFEALRKLQKLPPWLARFLFHRATRPLGSRQTRMGTFAVTSLGHRAVDGFQSVGGTAVTFGVGRVLDRPVVRDGRVTIAPVMRLSLAFDHRVIDGAEAADVLTETKEALESVPPFAPPLAAAVPSGASTSASTSTSASASISASTSAAAPTAASAPAARVREG